MEETAAELSFEDSQKILTTVGCDFEIKSAVNDKVVLDGWMSTEDKDYTQEVVLASSWDNEHWAKYVENPLYCWNHLLSDKNQPPIGRVNNPQIITKGETRGLYFGGITLTPYPFVKDILIPLVLDKVLTQQSVGFRSLKREFKSDTRTLVHVESWCMEGSLVPIGANRVAKLGQKYKTKTGAFREFETVEDVVKAYTAGEIVVARNFFVPESYAKIEEAHTETIKMKRTQVNPVDATKHRTDENAVTLRKSDPTYAEKSAGSHLLEITSETGKVSYDLCLGNVTDTGVAYDFNKAAIAVCAIMGARNAWKYEVSKREALAELKKIYDLFDKEFPKYSKDDSGNSIEGYTDAKLNEIFFKELTLANGESEIFAKYVAVNSLNDLSNIVTQVKDSAEVREAFDKVCKGIYGGVSINLYASVGNMADTAIFKTILDLVGQYQAETSTSEMVDLSFVKWLDGKDTKYGIVTKSNETASTIKVYTRTGKLFTDSATVLEVAKTALNPVGNFLLANTLEGIRDTVEATYSGIADSLEPIEDVSTEFADSFLGILD